MSSTTALSASLALLLSACGSGPGGDAQVAEAGAPDTAPSIDSGIEAADARSSHDAGLDAAAHGDGGDGDAGPNPCDATGGSLKTALDQARAQAGSPGAVLAVKTPQCRWVLASGTSTTAVPLDPADVLRVGSITKTFVATAVLQLASAGSLALGDSLEKWLHGFPNGAGITVTQLLNHTSGIFDYTQDPTWQSTLQTDPATVWTPQQLVDIAAKHPAVFAPGQGWGYSNTDYILLGMLLEKVTGASAGAVLHAQAIDRAALKWTTLPGYEPIAGTLAHGYSSAGVDVTSLFDPSYAWTAGALVSSAGDLADWACSLYGGSVLSSQDLSLMLQGVATGTSGETYGLGVFILSSALTGGGGPALGHPGDIDGYHSQMFYFPNEKTAVVALVNSDAADPNVVSLAAMNVLGL